MARNRTYYTLAIRDADGVWRAEFGDYTRQTCADEADTYDVPRRDKKIIKTNESQDSINAAIRALNESGAA